MQKVLLCCVAFGCIKTAVSANDWSRFRGVDGAGVALEQTLPAEMGPDRNQLWKTAVPAGTSSPIIVSEQCFATPAIAHNRLYVCTTQSLYCFGRKDTK